MKNNKIMLAVLLIMGLIFTGCSDTSDKQQAEDLGYIQVDAEKAKSIMDEETDYIILDVRTEPEYDRGHIPNSILVPDTRIRVFAEKTLTNKDQLILVYCQRGNRSKKASAELVKMGYTNVIEFGGIENWPYTIEKEPDNKSN